MIAEAWRGGEKGRVLELAVFLTLVVPPMVVSLLAAQRGGYDFVLTITQSVLRNLALLSLVLFLVWRSGEEPRWIGWTLAGAREDVVLGMLLCLPAAYGAAFLERLLVSVGLYAPAAGLPDFLRAGNLAQFAMVSVAVAVVAVAEETVFRGYLLLRLRAVLGPAGAVVASSVVFALGHGYQGSAGMVSVGALGVVYTLVYLWRGSLVAPIVMHFMQNLIGMVLLPLMER